MNEKNKHLLNYEIDELKFLEALSLGVTFKTTHRLFYSKQFGDRKHYEQTFQYELYSEGFLNLNKLELLRLGIIKQKK
ncbi:MAG: hypothetical protein ACRCYA_01600 [Cetobacterium sp.]|uniref:hypothetical protein n=1 Tax=Cetobacterium sp. TaxID=2071632 RepID=UPI003F40E6D3